MISTYTIPEIVRTAVAEIDPEATLVLFGSRARGDFGADSDWDFLVLTDREVTIALENTLRDRLYEVELFTGEIITSVIENKSKWEALAETPFYKNVIREGVEIKSPESV